MSIIVSVDEERSSAVIYTVTLNPAIDYVVQLKKLELGCVNRMDGDEKFPGGKGINVSRVLQRQGVSSTTLGFIGGFTGEFIKAKLEAEGLRTNFTVIAEDTRINIKIKSDAETEINSLGPNISEGELANFMQSLGAVDKNDVVVFSGSAPVSLGNDIYREMIASVRARGAEVVCDFEGQRLVDALAFNPLLVKPNKDELGAMYGVQLQTTDDIMAYGERLRQDGAKNVIVSMAGDGALLLSDAGTYFARPIKGIVKNSVGAGDSMVAGFIGSYVQSQDVIEAFKVGVACGTATAFSDDLATADFIADILTYVKIEKI